VAPVVVGDPFNQSANVVKAQASLDTVAISRDPTDVIGDVPGRMAVGHFEFQWIQVAHVEIRFPMLWIEEFIAECFIGKSVTGNRAKCRRERRREDVRFLQLLKGWPREPLEGADLCNETVFNRRTHSRVVVNTGEMGRFLVGNGR